MTPHSQPPSLVPPGALPSSGFSFWGLKGQDGSGTGTSPASPRLGPGPETPTSPMSPALGFIQDPVCRAYSVQASRCEGTPGPSLTFPWTGLRVSCSDAPSPPATLVSPEAGSMVPLCQGPPLPPGPHPRGPAQTTDVSPCPPHLCIPHLLSTRTLGSPDLAPASFLRTTSPCLSGRQLPSGTQCGPASSWGA